MACPHCGEQGRYITACQKGCVSTSQQPTRAGSQTKQWGILSNKQSEADHMLGCRLVKESTSNDTNMKNKTQQQQQQHFCVLCKSRPPELDDGVAYAVDGILSAVPFYLNTVTTLPPLAKHHSLLCGYRCLVIILLPQSLVATTTREHGDISNDPQSSCITCTHDMVATSYWCTP